MFVLVSSGRITDFEVATGGSSRGIIVKVIVAGAL
jgi:hypothetical protein